MDVDVGISFLAVLCAEIVLHFENQLRFDKVTEI